MLTSLLAIGVIASPGTPFKSLGLRVSRNRLLVDGNPITLRGVCTGDVILARAGRTGADFKTLAKDWNANCVRIGVAPTSWRNEPRARILGELKREVRAARAAGLIVIIDWHTIGWPDGYFQIPTWQGSPKDLYDGSLSLALDFWKTCATTFRDDPHVAFQLWCEPVFNAEDWKTELGSTWKIIKPHFQTLTDAIRANRAPNLVLASGNRWAYDMVGIKQSLLPDSNTAYEWHVYAGHDNNDPQEWSKKLDGLHQIAPVVVTEWGFEEKTDGHYRGTAKSFGEKFLKFIEDRKMGWTAWCWHPTWGPPMLKDDWKTPTDFGTFVKRALQKNKK